VSFTLQNSNPATRESTAGSNPLPKAESLVLKKR
jgi:hypothetical protein